MVTEDQQYWLDHGFILELLKQLPSYVFWKNTECIYLGCNDAFARSLGLFSPQEIIGKSDCDLPTIKEVSAAYQADDREVMQSGKPKLNIEEPQTFLDGRKKVLLTNKVPLRNKNGEVIGILGIYTDITELKQTQDALRAQIKKTEQAYHSKTEFLSMASHEIRNPVGNVINLLDFLKHELDKLQTAVYDDVTDLGKSHEAVSKADIKRLFHKVIEHYNEAKAEAYRSLNALINLGDLHRLQTEGLKCKFEPYPIEALVKKAIANSTYPNNQKVDIRLEIKPSVPTDAAIDWRNIYECLRIVIGNAIRFSQLNDIVKITIDTSQQNDRPFIVISVQDYGIGIATSQLAHIFITALDEKDRTETSHYRKPSLQLPQAKMRIEASGGSVQIKSVLNKGTTITLSVPYQSAANEMVISATAPFSKQANSQYFLLIEDDLLAQKTAKLHLEALGHRVDIAATGADAIKKALTNQYDIIWLDITLPDMNGMDVMRKIQEKIGNKVPFVAVTSHVSAEDMDYFVSQGVMTILTKPVTQKQFKACIEDVLATKEADNEDDNN